MLNGKFEFVANTPLGEQDGILEMGAANGVLTGSVEILATTADIKNGTYEGNEFKFETKVRTMFGAFNFDVTGIVDGDVIKLHMANPMVTIDTEGRRI